MKELKSAIEKYLKGIGTLGDVPLGPARKQAVTKENNQILLDELRKRVKSNNYIVGITLIILCVVFAVAMFLVIYHRDNTRVLGFVLGGVLLSNIGIIRKLRQLWIEKNIIDISVSILHNLPPADAAGFINDLYWSFLKQSPGSLKRTSE